MIDMVRIELAKYSEISIDAIKIFGCEEAAPIFIKQIGNLARECLALICLDTHFNIINYSDISLGNLNKVDIDYATILKTSLLSNAQYILIAHNHPTSILTPSGKDIEYTKKLGALCNIFGIQLLDSIIVGPTSEYTSIRSIIIREND